MVTVPVALRSMVAEIASQAFTKPTSLRFCFLMAAIIMTTGRRTVSHVLRTVVQIAPGHWSNYHQIFYRRVWSPWKIARVMATYVITRWCPRGRIHLVGDETVESHPGRKVYGKGKHRDAVRSSHSYIAWRWGHKWVVLAILVKFPFAKRSWALPILVALYRSREWNELHGKRHRTPSEIMRDLIAVMLRWFPDRKFSFTGDGSYGSHAMAAFGHRYNGRLIIVSRFPADANLFEPPKASNGAKGRPRVKGKKLLTPEK